ncbi:MAG: hypothetical protein QOE54_5043 [Streptosporangiaceae bacterium]|nr:hypothetical protein [Streptosporangiaceae bacterium]MDX6432677.1 hypothetical protein [Streptosporangiaceae bacterium]
MHTKVVICAGLLAGPAILMALPAAGRHQAATAGQGGVTVSPGTARSGQRIQVRAACDGAGSATASSPAWGTVRGPLTGANRLTLAPVIRRRLPARTYSVTVICDTGRRVYGSVAVVRGRGRGRGPHIRHHPFGAPMTGGGGSQGRGPFTGPFAVPLGLGLLTGALGLGVLSLGRARIRARGRG